MTERLSNKNPCNSCGADRQIGNPNRWECECDRCDKPNDWKNECVKELAEYETAEEEGRLVALPCNVGTEVFIIFKYVNCGEWHLSTKEHIVTDILLNRNRSPLFRITNLYGTENLENFGKTVFLTREEAEKALKEMKKGEMTYQ